MDGNTNVKSQARLSKALWIFDEAIAIFNEEGLEHTKKF